MLSQDSAWKSLFKDFEWRRQPYLAAVLFGVICAGTVAFQRSREPAVQWPATAAQILATLMLVVGLERDRLPPTRKRGEKKSAILVAVWVAVAFGWSTAQASINEAFTRFTDAMIIGALAALAMLIVILAIAPLRNREP
jgi:hypothetical protein